MSGLVDRFWAWALLEPFALAVVMLALGAVVFGAWWLSWHGNRLVALSVVAGAAWWLATWWAAWEREHRRPRP